MIQKFEEFIEDRKMNEIVSNDHIDDNELFEMANLSSNDTGLDVNVYVSLKYPGHEPRIKFQNNTNPSYDMDSLIPMSIDKDEPEIILPNQSKDMIKLGIDNYQLDLVKSWIRINYDILLELWSGDISIIDFSKRYKKVVVSGNHLYNEMVNEMARIRQRTSGLPMIVWVQPNTGEKTEKHDVPRIKFQDNTNEKLIVDDLVPISIDKENPLILVNGYEPRLNSIMIDQLKEWIKLNFDILMDYWNNAIFEDDLINGIKQYKEE